MTFNEFMSSKKFSYLFYIILIIALILIVFRAGMIVGSRNTSLFFERQERQTGFGAGFPSEHPYGSFMHDFYGPSHGTFGTIESIATSSATGTLLLEVREKSGNEKTVIVASSTKIIGSATSSLTLKIQEQAIVIGSPNDSGEIEARLIKIQ